MMRQVDTKKALVGLVIADALFIGVSAIPLFTGRVHDIFELSEGHAAIISGLYLIGVALSAFAMFFLLSRVRVQTLVRCASLTCGLGFILCWWSAIERSFELFALLWFIAGLGGGLTSASAVALTATTKHPEKTFPILSFFEVFFSSIGLVIVTWAAGRSQALPFLTIGLFILLGVVAIFIYFPEYKPETQTERNDGSSSLAPQPLDRRTRWLIGVLIFGFTMQFLGNMTHPFVELIGRRIDISMTTVGKLFVGSTLISFLGPILARLVVDRIGRALPMLIVMLAHILVTLLLVYSDSLYGFAPGVLLSGFLVFFLIPMVNGLVAHFDRSGRVNATVIGIATLGFASAAVLGGVVMTLWNSYIILAWLCCLIYFVAIPAICYPAWLVDKERRRARRSAGELTSSKLKDNSAISNV